MRASPRWYGGLASRRCCQLGALRHGVPQSKTYVTTLREAVEMDYFRPQDVGKLRVMTALTEGSVAQAARAAGVRVGDTTLIICLHFLPVPAARHRLLANRQGEIAGMSPVVITLIAVFVGTASLCAGVGLSLLGKRRVHPLDRLARLNRRSVAPEEATRVLKQEL